MIWAIVIALIVIGLFMEYPLYGVGVLVIVLISVGVYRYWLSRLSPEQRAERKARQDADMERYLKLAELKKAEKAAEEAKGLGKHPRLVPATDGQGYMCPKCHSKQFKVRRKPGQRAAIVAWGAVTFPVSAVGGGLVAAHFISKQVQCTTCGGYYITPNSPPDVAAETDA